MEATHASSAHSTRRSLHENRLARQQCLSFTHLICEYYHISRGCSVLPCASTRGRIGSCKDLAAISPWEVLTRHRCWQIRSMAVYRRQCLRRQRNDARYPRLPSAQAEPSTAGGTRKPRPWLAALRRYLDTPLCCSFQPRTGGRNHPVETRRPGLAP